MDTNGARDTSHVEGVTFLVAKRLAIIEAGVWNGKQHLVREPPSRERSAPPTLTGARSSLLSSIPAQGHKLHRQGIHSMLALPQTTPHDDYTCMDPHTLQRQAGGHSSQTR